MGLSQSEELQIAAAAELINQEMALIVPEKAIYQATYKAICYWSVLDENFITSAEIAKRTEQARGLATLPGQISHIHIYLRILQANGVAIKCEEKQVRGKPKLWAASSGTSSGQ
jgi:hypothetical protein